MKIYPLDFEWLLEVAQVLHLQIPFNFTLAGKQFIDEIFSNTRTKSSRVSGNSDRSYTFTSSITYRDPYRSNPGFRFFNIGCETTFSDCRELMQERLSRRQESPTIRVLDVVTMKLFDLKVVEICKKRLPSRGAKSWHHDARSIIRRVI